MSAKNRLGENFLTVYLPLLVLLLAIFILLATCEYVEIRYYDDRDVFGSLSRYPHVILPEVILPAVIMVVLTKYRTKNPLLYLTPLILLITVKFMAVDLVDKYYVTHFYDAPGHFVRGLYVVVSGHSNPRIDGYFDLQPAFFWVIAILLNIVGEVPKSYVDYPSMFLVKWFHIIAIMLYTPILYALYRYLFKDNLLASIAIFLHFGVEFTRFHYAAQTWGNALYWLVILLILKYVNSNDAKYLMLTSLVGISLVFLHQGVAVATILTLVALTSFTLFYSIAIKNRRGNLVATAVIALIVVLASWLIRLIYMAVPTFHSFVMLLRHIIKTAFTEGIEVIPEAASRADETWGFVVFLKSIYLGTLILLPLTLLSYSIFKKRAKMDMLLLTIQLFMTIVFGGIAVYLGGVGFIERLPQLTLPIIVYSVVKDIITRPLTYKRKNFNIIAIGIILTTFISAGTVFYMSGRNFQSIPYGDYHSKFFLVINDPQNILGIYPKLRIKPIRDVVEEKLTNTTLDRPVQPMVISVLRHDIIQTKYYVCSDEQFILSITMDLMRKRNLIYQNPDALLYFTAPS